MKSRQYSYIYISHILGTLLPQKKNWHYFCVPNTKQFNTIGCFLEFGKEV